MKKNTDWNYYYQNPTFVSNLTRQITTKKILLYLEKSFKKTDSFLICELGGANSCFVDKILKKFPKCEYIIIDNNVYGLNLLKDKNYSALKFFNINLINGKNINIKADFVFSVGLIEHFNVRDTKKVILQHFKLCKKQGNVLITFPTNTWLYKLSRNFITLIGKWIFWDERPLTFKEVENSVNKKAKILHAQINWWIFLTQGIIFSEKN